MTEKEDDVGGWNGGGKGYILLDVIFGNLVFIFLNLSIVFGNILMDKFIDCCWYYNK